MTTSDSETTTRSETIKNEKLETRSQQRIAQQLEEVRLGIFKLLSESDDEEKIKDDKHSVKDEEAKGLSDLGVAPLDEEIPGYQADEEEDDSHDSVSQSLDLVPESATRAGPSLIAQAEVQNLESTPTGVDNTDTTNNTVDMGCVSVDRDDRGTDSGIDRGQGSSRAASAEGWLARLTSRVGGRHHSGASAGSQSQVSSPDGVRRRGSAPESPRDGGFAEAGLEMRVRELWLRLRVTTKILRRYIFGEGSLKNLLKVRNLYQSSTTIGLYPV